MIDLCECGWRLPLISFDLRACIPECGHKPSIRFKLVCPQCGAEIEGLPLKIDPTAPSEELS